MVQEIRSLQKLAFFFQGLTLGAEGGGGLVRGTLRYIVTFSIKGECGDEL